MDDVMTDVISGYGRPPAYKRCTTCGRVFYRSSERSWETGLCNDCRHPPNMAITPQQNIELIVNSFNRDVAYDAQRLKGYVRRLQRLLNEARTVIELGGLTETVEEALITEIDLALEGTKI